MFDLVVGTSSGALIGAMLDTLPASYITNTLRSCYHKELFKPNKFSFGGILNTKYNTESKTKLIKEIIGDKEFRNFDYGAVAYDIKSNRPVIFNTLEQEDNVKYLLTSDFNLTDAVLASSAAPIYWDPHCVDDMILVDGALVCNDPTNIAIKLALDDNKKMEDLYIVNITTGNNAKEFNRLKGCNPLEWAKPIMDIILNGQAAATSMFYTNEGLDYYNLDVLLCNGSDAIDDVSEKNFINLDKDAEILIKNHKNLIAKIIKDLK